MSRTAEKTPTSPVSISLAELIALRSHSGFRQGAPPTPRAQRSGDYRSRFRGRGMEFAEVRTYQPGDDIRNIDWRVTARRGETHTKLFHEERERPVQFVLDYRRPMFFATRGRFKAVLASQCAAILAWNALKQGDRVGGVLFSEEGQNELKPRGGQRGVLQLLQEMVTHPAWLRPPHAPFSPRQRLVQSVQSLRRVVKPGTLVFVMSDFSQWDKNVEKELTLLGRHAELALCFFYDPLEAALPRTGSYRLSDGQGDLTITTGRRTSDQRYRDNFLAHHRQIEQFCQSHRARFTAISTQQEPQQALENLFSLRKGGQ